MKIKLLAIVLAPLVFCIPLDKHNHQSESKNQTKLSDSHQKWYWIPLLIGLLLGGATVSNSGSSGSSGTTKSTMATRSAMSTRSTRSTTSTKSTKSTRSTTSTRSTSTTSSKSARSTTSTRSSSSSSSFSSTSSISTSSSTFAASQNTSHPQPHPKVGATTEGDKHKSDQLRWLFLLFLLPLVALLAWLCCYRVRKSGNRKKRNNAQNPTPSVIESSSSPLKELDILNFLGKKTTHKAVFKTKEGRNRKRFNTLFGDSKVGLFNSELNLTPLIGSDETGLLVHLPLKTVAILKILFQENQFYSGEFKDSVESEYLNFIKDKVNLMKIFDRYSDCGNFLEYFDDISKEVLRTDQSIISCFNNECLVCREDFKSMDAVYVLPQCGHYFHPVCCQNWLYTSGTCPLCMTKPTAKYHDKETVQQVFEHYDQIDEIEREFWANVKLMKQGTYGLPF